MKKTFKMLQALAFVFFTVPCSAELTNEQLSALPSWVKRDSLKKSWVGTAETKVYTTDRYSRPSELFKIPNKGSRVELLSFRVEDPRFEQSPKTKDYDKDFLLPSASNGNVLKSLIILPSFVVNGWNVTVPKVTEKDVRFVFRREGNFF